MTALRPEELLPEDRRRLARVVAAMGVTLEAVVEVMHLTGIAQWALEVRRPPQARGTTSYQLVTLVGSEGAGSIKDALSGAEQAYGLTSAPAQEDGVTLWRAEWEARRMPRVVETEA